MSRKEKRFGKIRISYRPHTSDEPVIDEQFKRDIYFAGVPEYQPKPEDVIIDVGANIGAFSLLAASKVPLGKVYAIEPSKESFECLETNVKLNDARNIFPFHLALGSSRGTASLYHDPGGSWGNSMMKKMSDESESVPSDTLENFMSENSIPTCDFMKLNCEGAEFPIILSAPKETLARIRILLILYHSDLVENQTESSLMNRLQESGFTTVARNKTPNRGWIIASNAAFPSRTVGKMRAPRSPRKGFTGRVAARLRSGI